MRARVVVLLLLLLLLPPTATAATKTKTAPPSSPSSSSPRRTTAATCASWAWPAAPSCACPGGGEKVKASKEERENVTNKNVTRNRPQK